MTAVDLVALALAVGGLVDCWFNGSIFAEARTRLSRWELFRCEYCVNWQAPLWLVLLFYVPSLWLRHPWDVVVKIPIYWLAAAFAAWLVNEARVRVECGYLRAAQAAAAGRDYGGGTMPDPALFLADGETRFFCSERCRRRHETGLRQHQVAYQRGEGVPDPNTPTVCADCATPL